MSWAAGDSLIEFRVGFAAGFGSSVLPSFIALLTAVAPP